ncbi:MAG: biotin synthase BioB [Deltaproteobacteria bacterium]|jgi:biotin synthase|nr:biotin synthase BioB [Deltaproteobacteria bacterium]
MDSPWYRSLAKAAIAGEILPHETYSTLLQDNSIELLSLIDAAFTVRKHFHGKTVTVHIINNVSNGLCSEDCNYCPQSKSSNAEIVEYPEKSKEEILEEARQAYEAGAYRYCMVYAGRRPSQKRTGRIADLVKTIKAQYPIEVCVSAGIMDENSTNMLKQAGLDRLNHNLNTSPAQYAKICTTHTFADRFKTLKAARSAGLEVCSGIIAGMGESAEELIELALMLRDLEAKSIPINFLLPIPGNKLETAQSLTPEYCLKILCLFRFINPQAEIRTAAGREYHLRSLEVMSLYPANSLFMDGYLNTRGKSRKETLQMIIDAGFTIKSDKSAKELLLREGKRIPRENSAAPDLKSDTELHPTRQEGLS